MPWSGRIKKSRRNECSEQPRVENPSTASFGIPCEGVFELNTWFRFVDYWASSISVDLLKLGSMNNKLNFRFFLQLIRFSVLKRHWLIVLIGFILKHERIICENISSRLIINHPGTWLSTWLQVHKISFVMQFKDAQLFALSALFARLRSDRQDHHEKFMRKRISFLLATIQWNTNVSASLWIRKLCRRTYKKHFSSISYNNNQTHDKTLPKIIFINFFILLELVKWRKWRAASI